MLLSPRTETIFIIGGDPVTASSQKSFLETQAHQVKILAAQQTRFPSKVNGHKNIVILDMTAENPDGFIILNEFLQRRQRPKLLITAEDNHMFKQSDLLTGGPWQFLFKPYSPDDLLSAVERLQYSHYG